MSKLISETEYDLIKNIKQHEERCIISTSEASKKKREEIAKLAKEMIDKASQLKI